MTTKKIFSLDVGKVRVGVATFDDRGAVVALKTLKRAQGQAEREIQGLATTLNEVVVGIPLDDRDQLTETSFDIFRFCRRLTRRVPSIKISFVDEYGTSIVAEDKVGNSKETRRSGDIDAEAAKEILRVFVERGADERLAASFQAWLKECINDQKSDRD